MSVPVAVGRVLPTLNEDGSRLYGRGASDMKSSVGVMLVMLELFRDANLTGAFRLSQREGLPIEDKQVFDLGTADKIIDQFDQITGAVGWLATLHLVIFGWLLFRVDELADARYLGRGGCRVPQALRLVRSLCV